MAESGLTTEKLDRVRRPAVRRRLGRRHAADRGPVHRDLGDLGQRPRDVPRLPRGDPGPGGHARAASRRSRSTSPTTTSRRRATAPNVLVAMNPAGLRANVAAAGDGARRSSSTSTPSTSGPRRRPATTQTRSTDGSLGDFHLYEVPMTAITQEVCKDAGRQAPRRRALEELLRPRPRDAGCSPGRSTQTSRGSRTRFSAKPARRRGQPARLPRRLRLRRDRRALPRALRDHAAPFPPGRVREHHGQHGAGLGPDRRGPEALGPAALPRQLPDHAGLGHPPRALQAQGVRGPHLPGRGRDRRRSARRSARAFGGSLAVTTTAGPGLDLKAEAIGLAVSLELPLIIVDVQRGGPSTGLPTKVEQADLLQAMYGRHGESPMPVIAATTPSQCFDAAIEAVRIAVTYRTPVILLSDAYLANGSEPWAHPGRRHAPAASTPELRHRAEPRRRGRRPSLLAPTCATPRRWRGRGRRRACPASSTASAASRRPTARATVSYDGAQPRARWSHAAPGHASQGSPSSIAP